MPALHVWIGHSRRSGEREDEEERDQKGVSAAVAKLDELYAKGTPFFTRESILYIRDQIQNRVVKGDTVSVIALDGAQIDFDVDTGKVTSIYDDEDGNRELVV